MNKDILSTELANGVTVQDLINAYNNVLDGVASHDIVSATGLSQEDADKAIEVREATVKFWQL